MMIIYEQDNSEASHIFWCGRQSLYVAYVQSNSNNSQPNLADAQVASHALILKTMNKTTNQEKVIYNTLAYLNAGSLAVKINW